MRHKLRSLIIILLTIITYPANGQELTTWNVDSIGTSMAKELLEAKRTKEVLVFNSGCVGCEVIDDDCPCSDGYSMTYLIWKEQNKTWLTQLNCCANTETREFKDPNLWNELTINKDRIFSSEFKKDYIVSHVEFWYLKVLPTFPKELRIYDYYFDEGYAYRDYNKQQYANEFRKVLQKSIRENDQ